MSALQPDATRKYTFKLAGAVESRWHAVAVSSDMPRTRWAGQSANCVWYTFKLAGAVESRWHAVAVSSGMPRTRRAGQSANCVWSTGGGG